MRAALQAASRWPSLCSETYLHPGEVHAVAAPSKVTTILGSCVSVCLHEHGGQLGGLNHFLLPSAPSTREASTRYGDCAVDVLVKRLLVLGARRERLIAKLFGGANVLHAFADGVRHIGAANVDMARASLARHGIPIDAEHVGGSRGRKLVFSTPDGAAWIKVLGP